MTEFNDMFTSVRYDDETSYGSGGVSGDALSLGRVTNVNPNTSDNKGRHLGVGEGRNDASYTYGTVGITFSVEWEILSMGTGPARSNSLDFLKYGIGGVSGSGTEGAPYLITESNYYGYTAATNVLTFALWVQSEGGAVDDSDLYEGCFIENFTLSSAIDTALRATANCRAKKVTSAATIADAYVKDTNPPLVFQQGSFKWGQTPSAVALVQSFNLNVNLNPKKSGAFNSRFIEAITTGRRQYDWSVTLRMTDTIATTLRDDFYGQANSFIAGTVDAEVAADNEIELLFSEGSTTGDRIISIVLDQCTILGMGKSVQVGSGFVDVTFNGWSKGAKSNNFASYYLKT